MSELNHISEYNLEQFREIQNVISTINQGFLDALKPIIEWKQIYKGQLEVMQATLQQFSKMIDTEFFGTLINVQKSIVESLEPIKLQFAHYELIRTNLRMLNEFLINSISYSEEVIEQELNSVGEREKQELQNDIMGIHKSQNWQQRIYEIISKWKERNPIVASVLIFLLMSFFTGLIQSFGETVKSAFVYEKPASKSEIIIKLNINQEVRIIDEAPYYYEVETLIDDNAIKGWISKRSIRMKDIQE